MAAYPIEEDPMEPTATRQTFGLAVEASEYRPERDCLAVEERTASGNVPVRIGREIPTGGWEQVGYAVLTPDEVTRMAGALVAEPDRYAILTAARRELRKMASEHMNVRAGWGHGAAYHACDAADVAIFEALNAESSFLDSEEAVAAIRELQG